MGKQKMKFIKQIISKKLLIIALALFTTTLCVNLEASNKYNLRATNATASATTKYSQNPASSALGAMKNESRILSAPFKVTSCDQVIEIAGKTITDMNDYAQKADKFFTMSTYLVNQFEKKDSNTLTKSIGVEKIATVPSIIEGSVSCIGFYGLTEKIVMCLNTEQEAKHAVEAFKTFSKCRNGASIGGNNNNLIKILETSCLGLKIKPDPKIFDMKKDPQGKKIQQAISMALLKVSQLMRDQKK